MDRGLDEVQALVAELLAAGPHTAVKVQTRLVSLLRQRPAARASLPWWRDVPESLRGAIVSAHAAAMIATTDVEGLRALVADLEPTYASGIVHGLGNQREHGPWVPLAVDALGRDDADMRLAALYFVRHWITKGGDVAPLADALVRASLDDRRSARLVATVTAEARKALREGAVASADRAAFERAIATCAPARSRAALVKNIGETPTAPKSVKEAIAALRSDVVRQKQGLQYLGGALVGDMVDIRSALGDIAKLLSSADPDVRKEAAIVAYYGADLQGPTYEAQRMRPALEASTDERPEVREHVASALLALTRSAPR